MVMGKTIYKQTHQKAFCQDRDNQGGRFLCTPFYHTKWALHHHCSESSNPQTPFCHRLLFGVVLPSFWVFWPFHHEQMQRNSISTKRIRIHQEQMNCVCHLHTATALKSEHLSSLPLKKKKRKKVIHKITYTENNLKVLITFSQPNYTHLLPHCIVRLPAPQVTTALAKSMTSLFNLTFWVITVTRNLANNVDNKDLPNVLHATLDRSMGRAREGPLFFTGPKNMFCWVNSTTSMEATIRHRILRESQCGRSLGSQFSSLSS